MANIYAEADKLFTEADDLLGANVSFGSTTVPAVVSEIPVEYEIEDAGDNVKTELEIVVKRSRLTSKPAKRSRVTYNSVNYVVRNITEDEVHYTVYAYKKQ